MIVRIARAKVGHRQAPNKYKAPPGSPVRGFVLVGSLKVTCVGMTTSGHRPAVAADTHLLCRLRGSQNKPSAVAHSMLCLQGKTIPAHLRGLVSVQANRGLAPG